MSPTTTEMNPGASIPATFFDYQNFECLFTHVVILILAYIPTSFRVIPTKLMFPLSCSLQSMRLKDVEVNRETVNMLHMLSWYYCLPM